jgi:hypothetical protein
MRYTYYDENGGIADSNWFRNDDSTMPPATMPPEEVTKDWHEITGETLPEEVFADNLDINTLEFVAAQIQTLTDNIAKEQREDPESVLRGDWVNFNSSTEYRAVLEVGLPAVKPLYFILYKSQKAGLYEYIICCAINDITGYDFLNEEGLAWTNAYEFRDAYNRKVEESIARVSEILGDTERGDKEKHEQLIEIGIFAVAPLLCELDASSDLRPSSLIESSIMEIVSRYTDEPFVKNVDAWRLQHEQEYRDIIEILSCFGRAQKND